MRRPAAWLTGIVAGALVVAAVVVLATTTRGGAPSPSSASSRRGSGTSVTDRRELAPFTIVDLAGANTLVVHVGAPQSVAVTGDDNLVALVTTVVRDGRLVVDDAGNFRTRAPMRVAVTVPTLDGVELSGAGTVTVDRVATGGFTAKLGGAGTVVVEGAVDRLTAVLAGDGTLDLHDLVATDGAAQLDGTGTIRIHATSTLAAALTGTGTILYGGGPSVTTHKTGTGTVAPE